MPKLRVPTYGGGLGIDEVIGSKAPAALRLARRHGATNVRVFGSIARKQGTSHSDVDVLVDPVGVRRYRPIDLALALERLLGRRVDIATERSLYWFVQPTAVAEAVPL